MENILCVCNPKGGTGKTTTTICLAEALARDGKKVLIIDMDNLEMPSNYFLKRNIGKVNEYKNYGPDSLIRHTSNKMIDIMPLKDYQKDELFYPIGENNRLHNIIAISSTIYDLCIIDTSRLNFRFEIAISHNLLFTVSDYLSIEGINHWLELLRLMNGSHRTNCQIRGILLTMFDIRLDLMNELRQLLSNEFGDLVLENTIPWDVNIQKSIVKMISIFEYDPESPAAVAYLKVTEELMSKWMD